MTRSWWRRGYGPAAVGVALFLLAPAVGAAQFEALDGTLDDTFGTDGRVMVDFLDWGYEASSATAAFVVDGERIVVAGSLINNAPLMEDWGLFRLLPSGDIDATFAQIGYQAIAFDLGGTNTDVLGGAALNSDGKITLAGYAVNSSGNADFALARIHSNGFLDSTFGGGTGKMTFGFDVGGNLHDFGEAVAIQSDGKIVVAGSTEITGTDVDFAIARVDDSGTLDTTFGSAGTTTVFFDLGGNLADWVADVAIQSDGKIVVVGEAEGAGNNRDFAVARLLTSGSLDTSFGVDGKATFTYDIGGDGQEVPSAVEIQPDGQILVAGGVELGGGDWDMLVLRLTTHGALDLDFGSSGAAFVAFDLGGDLFDFAADLAIQPDGKILVVGRAQADAGLNSDVAVARLLVNGELDPSFNGFGRVAIPFDLGGDNNDVATAVAIQADGKIVAAGLASDPPHPFNTPLVRLNAGEIFVDGFESGDVSAWSASVP